MAHHDGHRHDHPHLRLARASTRRRDVHRIGRRQFLGDLGRGTLAIAVLGGVAAACSDDEPDAEPSAEPGAEPGAESGAESDVTSARASGEPDDGAQLRWAQASLGIVSAYVLVRGNVAAVVDTGQAGSVDGIGEALGMLGVTYDDVRHVVLTHSHPDHVGSLSEVLGRASSATPYAGADDIPNIASPVEVTAVGDGDDVFGLQVIHTPGHTPGSISVFDPGIGLLVAGDALNGNDDGTGISGANPRFTADPDAANASVRTLAELDVDAIGVGHGQPVLSGAGPLLAALAAEV